MTSFALCACSDAKIRTITHDTHNDFDVCRLGNSVLLTYGGISANSTSVLLGNCEGVSNGVFERRLTVKEMLSTPLVISSGDRSFLIGIDGFAETIKIYEMKTKLEERQVSISDATYVKACTDGRSIFLLCWHAKEGKLMMYEISLDNNKLIMQNVEFIDNCYGSDRGWPIMEIGLLKDSVIVMYSNSFDDTCINIGKYRDSCYVGINRIETKSMHQYACCINGDAVYVAYSVLRNASLNVTKYNITTSTSSSVQLDIGLSADSELSIDNYDRDIYLIYTNADHGKIKYACYDSNKLFIRSEWIIRNIMEYKKNSFKEPILCCKNGGTLSVAYSNWQNWKDIRLELLSFSVMK